jgi:hypothetical protein
LSPAGTYRLKTRQLPSLATIPSAGQIDMREQSLENCGFRRIEEAQRITKASACA